jgi:hypothetical protein
MSDLGYIVNLPNGIFSSQPYHISLFGEDYQLRENCYASTLHLIGRAIEDLNQVCTILRLLDAVES